jgi:hypothetical protein
LEEAGFRRKSLKAQLEELKGTDRRFGYIGVGAYKAFLRTEGLSRFGPFLKRSPEELAPENLHRKLIVARMLAELFVAEELVLFFDSSTVSDFSFRTKCWSNPKNRAILHAPIQTKSIRILVASTQFYLVALQLFRRLESQDLYDFIKQAALKVLKETGRSTLWLFLDNAAVHQNADFLEFLGKNGVFVLFNAVSNPAFNLVEDIFEFLKREIRLSNKMSPREAVETILNQARRLSGPKIYHLYQKLLRNLSRTVEGHADHLARAQAD